MELAFGLSIVIGLLLGLLGGGGSVLTVPMLVYWLHVAPKSAIATSFVVVGLSSAIALLPHARRQTVCWKSGLLFGSAGMLGAFGGGRLASQFSGDMLMALFGLVCLLTGMLMLLRRKNASQPVRAYQQTLVCPLQAPYARLLFDGLLVGTFTGMVGVGGGFMIVPALTLLVGLPMSGAIGTSLLVIVLNACAGLAGYSQHAPLDVELTAIVATGSVLGSSVGAWLSAYVHPGWLRRLFALLVIGVAIYTLWQSLSWEFLTKLEVWYVQPKSLLKMGLLIGLSIVLVVIGYWVHRLDRIVWTATPYKQEKI